MVAVHFLGRVLPKCVQISTTNPCVKWESPDIGLVMEFTTRIEKSAIDVECKLNRYTQGDFVSVYMRALDLARASVDLIAFATGHGLTVEFETFVDPGGEKSDLLLKDDSLAALCTTFTLTKGFGEINEMVLREPALFMAFNDLIASITLPHVSSVNCARAIEGLRHLIATPGSTDKQAWEKMRQSLQIDKAYLKLITDNSTAPRHGNRVHVPGTIATEIVRRSWKIMDRYLEYRKRGSKPLPTSEFPLIAG